MEVGLEPGMPTYSGGLGVLAGDTLRAAADRGLPMVGVTLLHRGGYFRQVLDEHGHQSELPVAWEPEAYMRPLPITVTVTIEGRRADGVYDTITLWQGQGGPARHTFRPNESEAILPFRDARARTTAVQYYEKYLFRTNNPISALLSAQVRLVGDPAGRIMIGLESAQNGSGTSANRLTAPSGAAFVDDNVAAAVPGTDLGPGAAIGVSFSPLILGVSSATVALIAWPR